MTAALLAGVLVLILVNAFFVSAEFALVRARRSRLEQMAEGDARARLAVHEIDEISEYPARGVPEDSASRNTTTVAINEQTALMNAPATWSRPSVTWNVVPADTARMTTG